MKEHIFLESKMNLSEGDKVTVLLNLLDRQINQIERREQAEQKWFEWQANLLIATFGAAIALSQHSGSLNQPYLIKILAIVLITIPTFLVIYRIGKSKSRDTKNAETADRIHQLLHLFEENYFGKQTPYPKEWLNNFALSRSRRTTPNYYIGILLLMMICVAITIWLVL